LKYFLKASSSEDGPFPGTPTKADPLGPPQWTEWPDEDVLPFFGQKVDEESLNYLGTHHANNHVFQASELRPLLTAFQNLFKEVRERAKYRTSSSRNSRYFFFAQKNHRVNLSSMRLV